MARCGLSDRDEMTSPFDLTAGRTDINLLRNTSGTTVGRRIANRDEQGARCKGGTACRH
jgi:hypothetical protein